MQSNSLTLCIALKISKNKFGDKGIVKIKTKRKPLPIALVETAVLRCSSCDEVILDPKTGSEFWLVDDMIEYPEITCKECEHEMRMPIKARWSSDVCSS